MIWIKEKVVKKIPELKRPILIEGLPGIGNVGKIVVDFIIEEIKAKKIYEFLSYSFPHSVFVNDKNLIELPKIELYYKKMEKGSSLLFLAGDVQPIEEVPSYEFSQMIVDMFIEFGGKEIITLGGIGLPQIPLEPKIYCTGNNKEMIERYAKGTDINTKLYGIVGPIIGATGLITGLAKKKNIPAICILAETYGHPMYLGIKGGREILKILSKKFNLKLNLERLDKEIKELEAEMKKTDNFASVTMDSAKEKLLKLKKSLDYIG